MRGDPAQRTHSLDWSKAGNEYACFDPSDVTDGGSGMVAWLRLKCLDAWKAQKKLQGHCASCPMCRHALA